MEITNNTYLKFIDFIDVSNWSVQYLKGTAFSYNKNFELVKIGNFLTRNKTQIDIENGKHYKRVTIKMNNNGVFLRDIELGENIGTKKQFLVSGGEFIMSKIDARNGAFGIVPNELKGAIVTNDFPSFIVDKNKINIEFLILILGTKEFLDFAQQGSSGTTGRQRVDMNVFLNTKIPLPNLTEQNRIVEEYNKKLDDSGNAENKVLELERKIESYLMEELGIEVKENKNGNKGLQIVEFSKIETWGASKIMLSNNNFKSSFHKMIKLGEYFELVRGVTYSKDSELNEGGYKVLRANNISLGGNINYDKLKYISDIKEKFDVKRKLKKNDLFICLASGSKDHIGKVAYIEDDIDYYFGGFMGAIRQISCGISPMYLFHMLNSKLFNKYLSDRIFGVNINNLNSELLYNFSFPLPPLEIQEKIVNHIGDLKEEIKSLKKLSEDLKESAKVEFEREIFS